MTEKINQYEAPIVFHPGEMLDEKLQEMDMGPKEFALRTNKPEKTIIQVLHGKSSITPEMAVQFEHVLKIPAHFWLNMQRAYDEFQAREEHEASLEKSEEWAGQFPLSDMVKKGWIPAFSNIREATAHLLSFFSISNHQAWENYYLNQQLKISFRISLRHTSEPFALSTWLRQGEVQAAALPEKPYSEKAFKQVLPAIKTLMAEHPPEFFQHLQALCLDAGVKVVHTPCINKAPVNGCTRWLHDTPLIQLSGRYKRNDIFWFTFFHEAGHILLHGKKDIFLENIEYSDRDQEKEKEADDFAIRWTLSREEEKRIIAHSQLSDEDILQFAREFQTHPAIIIGRLQHLGYLPHSAGRHFLVPVDFD